MHARHLAQLLSQPLEDDLPATPASVITTPGVSKCAHCHQPVTLVTKIAKAPDTSAEPGQVRACSLRRVRFHSIRGRLSSFPKLIAFPSIKSWDSAHIGVVGTMKSTCN
jgi:hypothetical protein